MWRSHLEFPVGGARRGRGAPRIARMKASWAMSLQGEFEGLAREHEANALFWAQHDVKKRRLVREDVAVRAAEAHEHDAERRQQLAGEKRRLEDELAACEAEARRVVARAKHKEQTKDEGDDEDDDDEGDDEDDDGEEEEEEDNDDDDDDNDFNEATDSPFEPDSSSSDDDDDDSEFEYDEDDDEAPAFLKKKKKTASARTGVGGKMNKLVYNAKLPPVLKLPPRQSPPASVVVAWARPLDALVAPAATMAAAAEAAMEKAEKAKAKAEAAAKMAKMRAEEA